MNVTKLIMIGIGFVFTFMQVYLRFPYWMRDKEPVTMVGSLVSSQSEVADDTKTHSSPVVNVMKNEQHKICGMRMGRSYPGFKACC
jgi:hypothetical protein